MNTFAWLMGGAGAVGIGMFAGTYVYRKGYRHGYRAGATNTLYGSAAAWLRSEGPPPFRDDPGMT